MAQQNKSPITAFIGAFVGLITFGMINTNLSILGAIVGAFIGYALGKEW
tara:strand:+ start:1886 stop:2032 length:147 start_codon:yes stop_codon:yes gene_type:complete